MTEEEGEGEDEGGCWGEEGREGGRRRGRMWWLCGRRRA